MKVSIITPSYKQGKFIERTIQSVLSQSLPESLEYLVFDGGSKDETVEILKHNQDRLAWISEPDKGQADAVNKGFKKASGDIIGWLNSDDIYYPDAIKTVCDFFAKNPDVDVVYGQANHIDENDQVIALYPTEEWNSERLKQTCFLSQPAVFFRRRVIEQFGLLDEQLHYCMDYEYWLRLSLQGAKFHYLEKVLAGSRLHGETKTVSQPLKAHQDAMLMLQQKLGYVPTTWLIVYAVAWLKSTLPMRLPKWFTVLVGSAIAVCLGIRYNGFVHTLKFFPLKK